MEKDPPLPTLRGAVISETMKALQIFEGAIRETRPGGQGHIDLEALDTLAEGLFSELGVFASSEAGVLRGVSPADVLAALDGFGREAETRSAAEESIPGSAPLQAKHPDPALRLISPLLPSFESEFRFRAQVSAWRSAAQLACGLCAFRLTDGAWPRTLQDLHDGPTGESTSPKNMPPNR